MDPLFFTVRLRTKRDIVLVRQRARQLAGLLGFAGRDQVSVAAAAFALACTARLGSGVLVCFQVDKSVMRIFLRAQTSLATTSTLCIQKPLPACPRLAGEDISWAFAELGRNTPLNVFQEIKELNNEVLACLEETSTRDGDRGDVREGRSARSA